MSSLADRVELGERGISLEIAHALFADTNFHIIASSDQTIQVELAQLGSLDAAKVLHDAALPGWVRAVDATAPEAGIEVQLWPDTKGENVHDDCRVKGDCENEAAAWVAAILRAKASLNRTIQNKEKANE